MVDFKNHQLADYKTVGGWLLLLCIVLTIISPLRTIYNLGTSYSETHQYFSQFPGLSVIFSIDCIFSAVVLFYGIRAGISLWKIKPGAVKMAKDYMYIFLGYSFIAIFLPFMAGLPSASNEAMIPIVAKSTFQSLLFFGIWFSYLNKSQRVKATYRTFAFSNENDNNPVEVNTGLPASEQDSELLIHNATPVQPSEATDN